MILIVNTCKYRLSSFEFVKPIKEIAEKFGKVKVKELRKIDKSVLKKAEKVIICGTALKDFEYEKFAIEIDEIDSYFLGICAGAQMIAKALGSKIIEKTRIGVCEVKFSKSPITERKKGKAYFLTKRGITESSRIIKIAEVENEIAGFMDKKKKVFGFLFYPEVLNQEVIERFLQI